MAFYVNQAGAVQHVDIQASVYSAAKAEGTDVASHLNKLYAQDCNMNHGTPFQQLAASEGLALPGANAFGMRAGTLEDVIEGRMLAAAPSNGGQVGAPFGSAARVLAPVAILSIIEDKLVTNYGEDAVNFDQMVADEQSIAGDNFIQPVVSYGNKGGPEQARATRVGQFSEPGNILQIGTAENYRSLPALTIGVEYSDKARRNLTIDVIAATIARYLLVEREARVYDYLNTIFNGDNDLVKGAIAGVTSASLDAASTGGVLTHEAWVQWLAMNRRVRRITHVMGDINAYLKFEKRVGRPGTNNYDPTLVRIDPQATVMNNGFGNDVKWFLTDKAVDGGPVPAGEIWGLDARQAITRIKNASADYSASESFALRRSTAMRWDWGEAVIRMHGDTDLRPFSKLVIS